MSLTPATSIPAPLRADVPHSPAALGLRFRQVRARSLSLAAPLSPEDAMLQSMDDTSPAKWHLAHTTWFFERFVLGRDAAYRAVNPDWDYLFNSYYQSVGPMHARAQRGLVSRPTLAEVLDYRDTIDARVAESLQAGDCDDTALHTLLLGTHHEQQHQELLLTDIKHAFARHPLKPAYREDLVEHRNDDADRDQPCLRWIAQDERIVEIGATAWPGASDSFAFDSESPRHRVLLQAHALAQRPVSNADYRAFIDDGSYRNPALWMSEGWTRIHAEHWSRPLYWDEDLQREFTLGGLREIDPHAPVCHLSYFEADAFARWAGARLPTEAEWEAAAAMQASSGHFVEDEALHPQSSRSGHSDLQRVGLQQLFGDVWEWTSTAYMPYPGFRALPGALGEYNGKFMCGQWILRGGSCVTPRDHIRASYRNFFYPPDRWQFSGLRLAKDLS
ncbi:MAG: ergothioneine biosynthesis protein EgtB [Pseudomonadota bacterium]|nr:ergothioneine biosynthesis protein EgtB [Pseudomonadota bacterium]